MWVSILLSCLIIGGIIYSGFASIKSKTPGLFGTVFQVLFTRGRRKCGVLTGIVFPICVSDLTGKAGPEYLTLMLRSGKHLPPDVAVKTVRITDADIKDGLKGDKAVIEVEYDGETKTKLPSRFFVKFNLQKLSQFPMRLLMETSECCKCEALFFSHIQDKLPIRTPDCYFVDYNDFTGEFVLLSEVINFADNDRIRPLKHRIRDNISYEEQCLLIRGGALLNSKFWGNDNVINDGLPRFHQTHKRMWKLAQLLARWGGLEETMNKRLKGKVGVNDAFMTWEVPKELLGLEKVLIRDMPLIMASLCDESNNDMMAYGHNDVVADNIYIMSSQENEFALESLGFFDWQQACVNNVGQEWAWNFHFLEPCFLTQHENEFIEILLDEYSKNGISISRERFLHGYVLGTVQMFVWGGGGLQLLLSDLYRRGIFQKLAPNDPLCKQNKNTTNTDIDIDSTLLEKIVGAEMTRRTFTNCCKIMQRHDFVRKWKQWRQEMNLPDVFTTTVPTAGNASSKNKKNK